MLFARQTTEGAAQATTEAAASGAEAVSTASTSLEAAIAAYLKLPATWPNQAQFIQFCSDIGPAAAILLILGGLAYLIYGNSMQRPLVTLNLTLLGAWIGGFLGHQINGTIPGLLIGAFIAAALSFPLLRPGIAVVAGVVGFSLGASVWNVIGIEPRFSAAGGLIGATFFSMLTFILLGTTLTLSTSLQGSTMIVVGALALVHRSASASQPVIDALKSYPYILLFCVIIPAVVGCIVQNAGAPLPAGKSKAS